MNYRILTLLCIAGQITACAAPDRTDPLEESDSFQQKLEQSASKRPDRLEQSALSASQESASARDERIRRIDAAIADLAPVELELLKINHSDVHAPTTSSGSLADIEHLLRQNASAKPY